MSEEFGLSPDQLRQPNPSVAGTLTEALELASRPSEDARLSDASSNREQIVEVAVVADPPPDVGIEHPSEIVQRFVAAPLKAPITQRTPDILQRRRTCCRQERDSIEAAPPFRQPRTERISEEVEADTSVFAFSVGILAVDQFGLLRMEAQTAGGERSSTARHNLRASRSVWQ
ncbi:hypothetical protein [Bradyrhizobium elkanii]|uniref:hypothetical protein n=1 Tax=Bradyrhizobium elkanii TaxID=29448 RepID=UPI002011AF19|nr:hypothetical protein [Bradyrhizobium elkanii]